MKKHAGRPKIGTENAKGVSVTVRLTPPEAKQLNQAVRQTRQSKSEWIRKTLLAAANGDKTTA
jgi:FKBP-type peptidyl-prolyl cis-trans isomerase (trigger factor)